MPDVGECRYVESPHSLPLAERSYIGYLHSGVPCGMKPVELNDLRTLYVREIAPLRYTYIYGAVGKPFQGLHSLGYLSLLAGYCVAWIEGERRSVHGGDEYVARTVAVRWHYIVGAAAHHRPESRLLQGSAHISLCFD